jgi:hypothetical protein
MRWIGRHEAPKLIAWEPEPHRQHKQADDLVCIEPDDMGAKNSVCFLLNKGF